MKDNLVVCKIDGIIVIGECINKVNKNGQIEGIIIQDIRTKEKYFKKSSLYHGPSKIKLSNITSIVPALSILSKEEIEAYREIDSDIDLDSVFKR